MFTWLSFINILWQCKKIWIRISTVCWHFSNLRISENVQHFLHHFTLHNLNLDHTEVISNVCWNWKSPYSADNWSFVWYRLNFGLCSYQFLAVRQSNPTKTAVNISLMLVLTYSGRTTLLQPLLDQASLVRLILLHEIMTRSYSKMFTFETRKTYVCAIFSNVSNFSFSVRE